MVSIKYDLKISKNFSGWVCYDKEDYTTDEFGDIFYQFSFKEGEIDFVALSYSKWNDEGELEWYSKYVDPKRFKSEFWKKLPAYANFEECSWKRTNLIFEPSENTEVNFSKITYATRTKCVV